MECRALPVISDVLIAEISDAPEPVRGLLENLLRNPHERVRANLAVDSLRDAYLHASVLTEKWMDDAEHVASASVGGADVVASWNFKHLVNPARIAGFNAVNAGLGYTPLVILTPDDICRSWKELGDE